MFEGYVGIRLWDGQLVDDVIFLLLLSLLIAFAIIFRSNFQHFVKMLKDVVYLKERQNLFDETIGKRDGQSSGRKGGSLCHSDYFFSIISVLPVQTVELLFVRLCLFAPR